MVQIDVPIAFGLGFLFVDVARKQLRTGRPEYYYRTLLLYNLFQIFFFSWIPIYFLTNYFGWETTHMWWHADSVTAYPSYLTLFQLIFFGAANLGFQLGYRLIRHERLWANRLVYLGILAYTLTWIFAQPHRTARLGTYEEWQAGAAPLFYEDDRFLFMLVTSTLIWAIGLVIFGRILRRDGRHLDRYPSRQA